MIDLLIKKTNKLYNFFNNEWTMVQMNALL